MYIHACVILGMGMGNVCVEASPHVADDREQCAAAHGLLRLCSHMF